MIAGVDGRQGARTAGAIHGRTAELRVIERLVNGPRGGLHAVLVTGEPGLGKTTLLDAGLALARAHGRPVLTMRGSEAGAQRSFSGLVDLLGPVEKDVFATLPEPQRVGLDVALGRAAARSPVGPREIAAGLLTVLRRLGPALIVVDDLPWLDVATADALRFALRRVGAQPLRVLASCRTSGAFEVPVASPTSEDVLPAEAVEMLALGPADRATIERLLVERHQLRLPSAVLDGLVEQTGGNPFWALEIGATLAQLPGHDGYLPISPTLSSLVARRLQNLPAAVGEALLVVSALPQPSPALAVRVLAGEVADPAVAVDAAVAAGVIAEADGRLRPAHPLLGSAALEGLTPERRRRLHRRLAATVTDPEQRARHLEIGRAHV